jgi:hypothetical protein
MLFQLLFPCQNSLLCAGAVEAYARCAEAVFNTTMAKVAADKRLVKKQMQSVDQQPVPQAA